MPIFFVLSGYLFHQRPIKAEFKHGVINLLVPYLTTVLIILAVNWIALRLPKNPFVYAYYPATRQGILAAAYGAGSEVFNPWGWQVMPVGAVWFLLCLFIAVQLFNGWIQLTEGRDNAATMRVVIVLSCAVLGGVLGKHVYLPWALNAALFSQLFLYAGYVIRKFKLIEKTQNVSWYVLFGFFWLASTIQGYFVLTVPAAPNMIIGAIGGIGASLCIIGLCRCMEAKIEESWGLNLLARYGRLSLIVLCFHLIDLNVVNIYGALYAYCLPVTGQLVATIIGIAYRIAFVTFWMFIIPKIPLLRAGMFPRKFLRFSIFHRKELD